MREFGNYIMPRCYHTISICDSSASEIASSSADRETANVHPPHAPCLLAENITKRVKRIKTNYNRNLERFNMLFKDYHDDINTAMTRYISRCITYVPIW